MDETDWEVLLIEAKRGGEIPPEAIEDAICEAQKLFGTRRVGIHQLAAQAILALLQLATHRG